MNRHKRKQLVAEVEAYLAFYAALRPYPAYTWEVSQTSPNTLIRRDA